MEQYLTLKNKDFAFKMITLLIRKNQPQNLQLLTDPNFCKTKFDMNYPVLQEVPQVGSVPKEMFMDSAGNRRYYPEPISAFGTRYILCNDWYYKGKSSQRDTRTNFVNWVLSR